MGRFPRTNSVIFAKQSICCWLSSSHRPQSRRRRRSRRLGSSKPPICNSEHKSWSKRMLLLASLGGRGAGGEGFWRCKRSRKGTELKSCTWRIKTTQIQSTQDVYISTNTYFALISNCLRRSLLHFARNFTYRYCDVRWTLPNNIGQMNKAWIWHAACFRENYCSRTFF